MLTVRNAQKQKRLQEKLQNRPRTISQQSLENQQSLDVKANDMPTQSCDTSTQSRDALVQSHDIKDHSQPHPTKLQDILASTTTSSSEHEESPLINENMAKMVAAISLRHRKTQETTFGTDSSDDENT